MMDNMLECLRRIYAAYDADGADLSAWAGRAADEIERLARDAERYRWLCANNFDREGATQVHTWLHTWEPHSQTGEPTEWKQRIRGGALDLVIDEVMAEDMKRSMLQAADRVLTPNVDIDRS